MDYSSEVLRRFRSPQRAGELVDGTAGVVRGEAEDRSLNVWVRFHVQVLGGRIEAVRFQVFGCPHTIAAAAAVAEWLEGRDVGALAAWDVHAAARALEVPTEKVGKLLRIEDALLACWRAVGKGNTGRKAENGSVVDAASGG
jgi:NifU-like protein involved in Fe-S cluster formation